MSKKKSVKKRNLKKSNAKGTTLIISLLTVFSLLVWGYKALNRHLQTSVGAFEVQNILVHGNHLLSKQQILHLCGPIKEGQKLLRLNPQQITRRLLASPYIKGATAIASLPATLRIVIQERTPVAFIYGRGLNLIDEQGVLMPVPRSNLKWNLPFITGISQKLGVLGERTVSGNALRALEILQYLRFIDSPLQGLISEIDMSSPSQPVLRTVNGGAAIKIAWASYQDNLYILSQYFSRFFDWRKLAQIEYFDMRFKRQLIIKNKKS